MLRSVFLAAIFACTTLAFSVSAEEAWTGYPVPEDKAAELSRRLSDHQIPNISWQTGVTEVSAYGNLENQPLQTLETRLDNRDPRWDPWLRGLKSLFVSGTEETIWVPVSRAAEASGLLGSSSAGPSPAVVKTRAASPRQIAGWTFLALVVLMAVFVLPMAASRVQRRLAVLLPLVLVCSVWLLAGGSGSGRTMGNSSAELDLYTHHLWYQAAYPYGAKWDDYAVGKPIEMSQFTQKAGVLTPAEITVINPDKSWLQKILDQLATTNAARILGPALP